MKPGRMYIAAKDSQELFAFTATLGTIKIMKKRDL